MLLYINLKNLQYIFFNYKNVKLSLALQNRSKIALKYHMASKQDMVHHPSICMKPGWTLAVCPFLSQRNLCIFSRRKSLLDAPFMEGVREIAAEEDSNTKHCCDDVHARRHINKGPFFSVFSSGVLLLPPHRLIPSSLSSFLKNSSISCLFCFCVTWRVGTRSGREGTSMWGWRWCCCRARWGPSGRWAAGSSRRAPPGG